MEPTGRSVESRRGVFERSRRVDENRRIATLTVVSLAMALMLASQFPQPVFLPMLATLLSLSATATAFAALVLGQPIFARTFTFWDKAAALLLLSLAALLAADHEAARLFLEARAGPEAPTAFGNSNIGEN